MALKVTLKNLLILITKNLSIKQYFSSEKKKGGGCDCDRLSMYVCFLIQ